MLYVVATPIGNLKDITVRALEVLREVDLIACEDTRHTHILLAQYGIATPTTSYFQHNRLSKGAYLIERMREGARIALVSDAGTPGILDPGYHLINLSVRNGIPVTIIPGPCALVAGLVISGKPAHEFVFAGFLPPRSQARKNALTRLLALKKTIVCYESCHRIIAFLEDMVSVCPQQEVVVTREITKKFEEVLRGTPQELADKLKNKKAIGEFVVII